MRKQFDESLQQMRKDTIMKKKRFLMLAIAVMCFMAIAGVSGLKTAAASGTASVGNFSKGDGRVVFRSEDITYLNRELAALRSEIDDSVFDSSSVGTTVLASANKRRSLITSHGAINYDNGKVVANAAGLLSLADETDALANTYATVICRALNHIGTYFAADGSVNHESQTAETIVLSCERLAEGILRSQSVDHLTAASVTADNITAGAAAWVNGQCIIGNGADNERAYQRGLEDGAAGNDEDVDIRYTYHVHRNGEGEEVTQETVHTLSDPGGCYRTDGHTHHATGTCPTTSSQCGGYGGPIEHHPSCIDSDSGWGTDNEHIHCQAHCQVCGSTVAGAYAPCTRITISYLCDNPTNTWKIGCGKKVGQIESATVVIRKNNGAGE